MHADLASLLDLQTKDLALLAADARLKAILDEVGRLDGQLESARNEVTVHRKRLEEATKRRDEMEVRIESYRTIQERRRHRLEQARGAREAQALMTEVEMARSVLVKEEAEWMKAAETVQELEKVHGAAVERLAELETTQAAERERLAEEQQTLEEERGTARAARDASASQVERTLRLRYDRLRSARTNEVVVALRGEACGACFTTVPRNRRTQIRAGLLLDACEACGVILYASEDE